jgi:hypothetical protein
VTLQGQGHPVELVLQVELSPAERSLNEFAAADLVLLMHCGSASAPVGSAGSSSPLFLMPIHVFILQARCPLLYDMLVHANASDRASNANGSAVRVRIQQMDDTPSSDTSSSNGCYAPGNRRIAAVDLSQPATGATDGPLVPADAVFLLPLVADYLYTGNSSLDPVLLRFYCLQELVRAQCSSRSSSSSAGGGAYDLRRILGPLVGTFLATDLFGAAPAVDTYTSSSFGKADNFNQTRFIPYADEGGASNGFVVRDPVDVQLLVKVALDDHCWRTSAVLAEGFVGTCRKLCALSRRLQLPDLSGVLYGVLQLCLCPLNAVGIYALAAEEQEGSARSAGAAGQLQQSCVMFISNHEAMMHEAVARHELRNSGPGGITPLRSAVAQMQREHSAEVVSQAHFYDRLTLRGLPAQQRAAVVQQYASESALGVSSGTSPKESPSAAAVAEKKNMSSELWMQEETPFLPGFSVPGQAQDRGQDVLIAPSVCLPKYINSNACVMDDSAVLFLGGFNPERNHALGNRILLYDLSKNRYSYVSGGGTHAPKVGTVCSAATLQKHRATHCVLLGNKVQRAEVPAKHTHLPIHLHTVYPSLAAGALPLTKACMHVSVSAAAASAAASSTVEERDESGGGGGGGNSGSGLVGNTLHPTTAAPAAPAPTVSSRGIVCEEQGVTSVVYTELAQLWNARADGEKLTGAGDNGEEDEEADEQVDEDEEGEDDDEMDDDDDDDDDDSADYDTEDMEDDSSNGSEDRHHQQQNQHANDARAAGVPVLLATPTSAAAAADDSGADAAPAPVPSDAMTLLKDMGGVFEFEYTSCTWRAPQVALVTRHMPSSYHANSVHVQQQHTNELEHLDCALTARIAAACSALFSEDLRYRCRKCLFSSPVYSQCCCTGAGSEVDGGDDCDGDDFAAGSAARDPVDRTWVVQFSGYCSINRSISSSLHVLVCSRNSPPLSASPQSQSPACSSSSADEYSYQWMAVAATGPRPDGRFSHSSVVIPYRPDAAADPCTRGHTRILYFGGICYVPSAPTLLSLCINRSSSPNAARYKRTIDAVREATVSSAAYAHWEVVTVLGAEPERRQSHSMVHIGDDHGCALCVLYGGMTTIRMNQSTIRAASSVWCLRLLSATTMQVAETAGNPVVADRAVGGIQRGVTLQWERVRDYDSALAPSVRARHVAFVVPRSRCSSLLLVGGSKEPAAGEQKHRQQEEGNTAMMFIFGGMDEAKSSYSPGVPMRRACSLDDRELEHKAALMRCLELRRVRRFAGEGVPPSNPVLSGVWDTVRGATPFTSSAATAPLEDPLPVPPAPATASPLSASHIPVVGKSQSLLLESRPGTLLYYPNEFAVQVPACSLTRDMLRLVQPLLSSVQHQVAAQSQALSVSGEDPAACAPPSRFTTATTGEEEEDEEEEGMQTEMDGCSDSNHDYYASPGFEHGDAGSVGAVDETGADDLLGRLAQIARHLSEQDPRYLSEQLMAASQVAKIESETVTGTGLSEGDYATTTAASSAAATAASAAAAAVPQYHWLHPIRVSLSGGSCPGTVRADLFSSVLCRRCGWVRTLLSAQMKEAQQGEVGLVDVDVAAFCLLLMHLYADAVVVTSMGDVVGLLELANQFGLPGLVRRCEGMLVRLVRSENVCELLDYADTVNLTLLKAACIAHLMRDVGRCTLRIAAASMPAATATAAAASAAPTGSPSASTVQATTSATQKKATEQEFKALSSKASLAYSRFFAGKWTMPSEFGVTDDETHAAAVSADTATLTALAEGFQSLGLQLKADIKRQSKEKGNVFAFGG